MPPSQQLSNPISNKDTIFHDPSVTLFEDQKQLQVRKLQNEQIQQYIERIKDRQVPPLLRTVNQSSKTQAIISPKTQSNVIKSLHKHTQQLKLNTLQSHYRGAPITQSIDAQEQQNKNKLQMIWLVKQLRRVKRNIREYQQQQRYWREKGYQLKMQNISLRRNFNCQENQFQTKQVKRK